MKKSLSACFALALLVGGFLPAAPQEPALHTLKIQLPLGRKAYQTNEWIDLAVVRAGSRDLPASDLKLQLTGADASKMSFTFPLKAAAVTGKEARQTEHLHLNGRLLRPGKYTIEAGAAGSSDKVDFDLHSHVRKTPFKLIDWSSRAKGAEQEALGEDSLGFNLLYASYGGLAADETIRGGLDYMWCCTMSGAHQMDIRMECDWSDPYVLGGGTARVVRRAFQDRVNPNALGVHFYDEPGLTWHKHPVTGDFTPHNIPAQDRAFQSAFDRAPLPYFQLKPDNPKDVARWLRWGRWKESFMEAAWKHAAFGVNQVRADFIPVTQSAYGWSAFTDGYYFNVVRSLPVISGHGGYDDYGGAYFNPSYTFEYGRMRDLRKPNWYLPAWYNGMPANRFRLEQYLSFMNNLQGMAKPPDQEVHRPSRSRATVDGVVESNKLMARLGPIFTAMPVTRPEVAVLYSLSQNLKAQTKDMKDNYEGGKHGRQKTFFVYLAAKLIHRPLFPIVEEDVRDGTLATHHKAVVLPGIDYLDPKVIAALETYIADGGAVLVSDDSKVKIKGAIPLGAAIDVGLYDRMAKAYEAKNQAEIARLNNAGAYMKAVGPVAKALATHFQKLGIKPVLDCDNPSVIVSRQASGDVEYLFAVNASYDAGVGGMNSIATAVAALGLPVDGRPVYNAVVGGPEPGFAKAGARLTGTFRFGPGQMRAFARTARPIGGVQALTPVLFRDYTVAQDPIHVDLAATVADVKGRPLVGPIPLRIKVIDPLGATRYDLYRATTGGSLKVSLPLAVNDPKGEWQVVVSELLANTEDTAKFTYAPPAQCGALAGATHRAVSFGEDRDNSFRFFSLHKDVTVAAGAGPYNQVAAERLARILKPWGVRCKIVKAADINKPRTISEEEANTWCGLEPGKVKAGTANNPQQVGFAVQGPVVLLGTPQDNPLIDFLQKARFLPYQPDAATFPGPGRGYMAWQRDGIGYGQESLTLIAYDAPGMAEAVGSVYEAATGLRPLTKWRLPTANSIAAAVKSPPRPPYVVTVWKTQLPDRAAAIRALPGNVLLVLSQDGSLTTLDAKGKTLWQRTIAGGDAWALDASADGNLIVVGASQLLVAFDGKGKKLFDLPTSPDRPAGVVTFVAVAPDGKHIAAGADNGKLSLVSSAGKRLWTIGGVNPNDKTARPNPYLAGIFSADGKTLLALTQNEAHALTAADGKAGAKTGGVSGTFPPQRVGANLLLSDGNTATFYATAQNQVEMRFALPPIGTATLALAGDDLGDLVIGGEIDGLVRKLKTRAAHPMKQVLWESKTPGRLVKQVTHRAGLTAVAYWGGLLRVFDAQGAVKAERTFTQDVSALAWNGDQVVVGIADGRVLALSSK